MLTEFEVRRRMADIAQSSEAPLKKVRRLLLLERRVRSQAAVLESSRSFATKTADPNARAHLTRLTEHARALQEDLRCEAMTALHTISKN